VLQLAGVIDTAGFIPNMLRKGAIDLLLTKPMSRPLILIFKYLGGMLFVFLLTTFTVGGVWVAIGLRTGVWAPGLLYCIFGVTFYFAILYACSTLFGVLTRNAIVSIVVTIVFWFVVWLIGTIHNTVTVLDNLEVQRERPASAKKADEKADNGKTEKGKTNEGEDNSTTERDEMAAPRVPKALVQTFDILNAVTPRTKDLDTLTTKLISQDLLSPAEQRQAGLKLRDLNWGEVLGVAGAYIALFLGLAMLRFVTRSY
jgi:ABC-type transport system involved in multi-copper enzyme maturation permease subunit